MRLFSIATLFVFILDQSLKYFYFVPRQEYVLNDAWYTVAMLPFFVTFIGFVYAQQKLLKRTSDFVAMGLVVGGSVSNLIDVFGRGGVVDYISLFEISHFNLADSAIVVGLGVLTYRIFK